MILSERAFVDLGHSAHRNPIALKDDGGSSFGSSSSVAWNGNAWLVTWVAEIDEEERGAVFLRRFAWI